jgi:hypothetical protein
VNSNCGSTWWLIALGFFAVAVQPRGRHSRSRW